jgi:hypothetical protein
MPIGTVDYISTAPWNDPANPWPAYAQLQLSATDIQSGALLTYTTFQFDPVAQVISYSAGTEEGNYIQYYSGIWNIIALEEFTYYELPTAVRDIPAGYKQGNTDWQTNEGNFETSISIIPVTTSLNPWEHRRRRLLEIV